MSLNIRNLLLISAIGITVTGATGCGTATPPLKDTATSQKSESDSEIPDYEQLINESFELASGLTAPEFKPFSTDGSAAGEPPRGDGLRVPPPPHAQGPHIGGRPPLGHRPAPLPADIVALFKAAHDKKDTLLGIDKSKLESILQALRGELESLRSTTQNREEFQVKAKDIQLKYAEELKTVLPTPESLTQEQKDAVKALHDLQRKVIQNCVAANADAKGSECSAAKSELQAAIDAP